MVNIIMALGGIFFGVLFAFLVFVFVVFVVSLFSKNNNIDEFEPEVSVVIPAYNEEKNIGNCLKAIKEQNYPMEKLDIIMVDDGSRDNTVNFAKSYGIRIIEKKHSGKADTLNVAVENSSYNIILTVDADTILDRDCLRNLVRPFSQGDVGATTGNSKADNKGGFFVMFQNIEYHYNNLIRGSFSRLFKNGIWFFGAVACYRKDILKKVGYFKKDTLAEDMDIALEINKAGYRTVNIPDAIGCTKVPSSFREYYNQRARWWLGTLQALIKNKQLLSKKSIPIKFLYINQFWWSAYAFISLPLIIYQINYWLPYNSQSFFSLLGYLFRWFSLSGPLYVIYKIPEWGLSFYSIFGVLSGIISAVMILSAIKAFKEKLGVKNIFALFFYFPYTIFLNIVIIISILNYRFYRAPENKSFIR